MSCAAEARDDVTAWRVRAGRVPETGDEALELNEDAGWLAAANANATVPEPHHEHRRHGGVHAR